MHLAILGRETPELPRSVLFAEADLMALACCHQHAPNPPETPATLGAAIHRVAWLGGFLGRQGDCHPGAAVLWAAGRNKL